MRFFIEQSSQQSNCLTFVDLLVVSIYWNLFQVCIGTKKKTIQIWSVDQEKITVLKEINVNEVPHLLVRNQPISIIFTTFCYNF